MRSTTIAAGILAIALITPLPARAASIAGTTPVLPRECLSTRAVALAMGATSTLIRRGILSLFGRSVRVSPATIDLSQAPLAGAAWRIAYSSLVWLVPLAVDSFESGDVSGRALVTAYVAAALRTSPDPGSASPAALARAMRTGWNEASVTKRQRTLNCLIQIQPGSSVFALLNRTIRANLDPRRHYGPPIHRVHNHGLMANHALIDSGMILRRPALIAAADARLLRAVAIVRDPRCGMVYEQAAHYQGVNARLWTEAAERLAGLGRARSAAALRTAATQMTRAFDHLVTPGGTLPAVGDTSPRPGLAVRTHGASRMLCRLAGWAVGRDSWTAGSTHYTLRFGPATTMHGHHDHGSVTWWVNEDVLIDPGYYYFKDLRPVAARYAISNAAHNVLGVSGVELAGATSLLRASWSPGADTYTVRDRTRAVIRTRSVWIDRKLPLLMVLDRASSAGSRMFTQRWHVAPGWTRTATAGLVRRGSTAVGFVALDLHTGRMLPRLTRTSLVFPTSRTISRGLVLSARKAARAVAIFTVVYRTSTGRRPVLRWLPGPRAGIGTVRVWWGCVFRDIRMDRTGILPG